MQRIALAMLGLLFASGCLPTDSTGSLIASISINVTSGPSPLTVNLSAAASSTSNEIATATWDFGDGSTGTGVDTTHTFTAPGRYTITVTLEDTSGATASASQSVQVQGSTPTAAATASVTSGNAPLGVLFNGTASAASDDIVDDWRWDFGDGNTASGPTPSHIYTREGNFEVTLTATTAGGVSSTTTLMIEVGAVTTGSLQFNGSQFATLPAGGGALTDWTFEAQVQPSGDGGTIVEFGSPTVAIEIDVDDRLVRVVADALTGQLSTGGLATGFDHIAVTHTGGTIEVFLNGEALGSIGLDASTTGTSLVLGQGYSGQLAQIRFWNIARSSADISSTISTDPDPGSPGLVGNWRLDEGSGQVLANDAAGGLDGVRGAMVDAEASDPAWSTTGP